MLDEKWALGGTCLVLDCCVGLRSPLCSAVRGWLHGGTIEQCVTAEKDAAERLFEEDDLVLRASAVFQEMALERVALE